MSESIVPAVTVDKYAQILRARSGGMNTPAEIAFELDIPIEAVQTVFLAEGLDWAAPRLVIGRPIKPLLPGQQLFVERAYRSGWSMARCSTRADVPIGRVRRHLLEGNHYRPGVQRSAPALLSALVRYIAGEPVMQICTDTGIRPPVLYEALKARSIPLRSRKGKEGTT